MHLNVIRPCMVHQILGKCYGTLVVTHDQGALIILAPHVIQELPQPYGFPCTMAAMYSTSIVDKANVGCLLLLLKEKGR
jgi:hypothetical protein